MIICFTTPFGPGRIFLFPKSGLCFTSVPDGNNMQWVRKSSFYKRSFCNDDPVQVTQTSRYRCFPPANTIIYKYITSLLGLRWNHSYNIHTLTAVTVVTDMQIRCNMWCYWSHSITVLLYFIISMSVCENVKARHHRWTGRDISEIWVSIEKNSSDLIWCWRQVERCLGFGETCIILI